MNESVYRNEMKGLEESMARAGDSPYAMFAKVVALTHLNMATEKFVLLDDDRDHPYLLARDVVRRSRAVFDGIMETAYIQALNAEPPLPKSAHMEDKHKELFNSIWDRYSPEQFETYINRYEYRIDINNLGGIVSGAKCLDFGCGNGVFCFALTRRGAAKAVGVDYGEQSIAFARQAAQIKDPAGTCEFKVATVYDTGYPDESFDFVLQNGVFHHLENEERAVAEMARVTKTGGWCWYYDAGEGGVMREFRHRTMHLLRNVPVEFIDSVLVSMNIDRNKIVHLMDLMSATYAVTSWDKLTAMLASHGFGDFRRLNGGFDTDFDLERIERDHWGREKFGEGDLRVLCRKTG